ncbi:MAG: hypothetical protein IIA66_05790 [Planctomycetes bacterium]|nr:hypothetical protein [Planctomycetota bacterium]
MSSAAHQGKYNKFVAVCVITLLGTMSQAGAQGVWTITNTDTQQDTDSQAEHFIDPPPPGGNTCQIADACQSDDSSSIMVADLFKKDFVGSSFAACSLSQFSCPLRAAGLTQVEVDGAGSETLLIGWDLISRSNNNCKLCPGFSPDPDGDTIVEYKTDGEANLTADIELVILVSRTAPQLMSCSSGPSSHSTTTSLSALTGNRFVQARRASMIRPKSPASWSSTAPHSSMVSLIS